MKINLKKKKTKFTNYIGNTIKLCTLSCSIYVKIIFNNVYFTLIDILSMFFEQRLIHYGILYISTTMKTFNDYSFVKLPLFNYLQLHLCIHN